MGERDISFPFLLLPSITVSHQDIQPVAKAARREGHAPVLAWELQDGEILDDLRALYPVGRRPAFNPLPQKVCYI